MLKTILCSTILITCIEAKCADLSLNKDFQNEDLAGKTYIIALKAVYPLQIREARCGITDLTYQGNNTFQFDVSYQDKNGTIENSSLRYTHTQKGNLIQQTNTSDAAKVFTVIALQRNKYFIGYACDAKSDKEAVWVHYYERVNGLNEIDVRTRNKIKAKLKRFNIKPKGLTQADNKDCNN